MARILIVDDSGVMRKIVRKTLRQAGFGDHQITEAEDGAIAYTSIVADTPDLVLCDWNMPNMSGIELLRKLRADGRGVRFGFITTEGTPEMRNVAAEAGAAFLIAKPFTPDMFRESLSPILG
ncbi:MAG: response regulator [Myxococcales bacterium]|nr:response regulator [Myxococcales bacterium]